MKIWILLFLPLLAFSMNGRYHRIHIGPEIQYEDFKQKFSSMENIKESGLLKGYDVGYDYIQPNGFYFGTNYYQDFAKIDDKEEDNKTKYSRYNYEVRGGINLSFVRGALFIPFGGYGFHEWKRKTDSTPDLPANKYEYKWQYICVGLKVLFFTTFFDFGVSVKLLELIKAEVKIFENQNYQRFEDSQKPTFNFKKDPQYHIEVPIYFHPSGRYSFDLGIIGFFKDIDLKKTSTVKTFQSDETQGPTTKINELGIRAEVGLYF